MKLNKKTDTAIQILLYLRNNNYVADKFKSAHQMSDTLGLSYNNIRKILSELNELGFIVSKLGKDGGIALDQNYNHISIKTLLIQFETEDKTNNKINCDICTITPSCRFIHITQMALINFYNTYSNIYLDDL